MQIKRGNRGLAGTLAAGAALVLLLFAQPFLFLQGEGLYRRAEEPGPGLLLPSTPEADRLPPPGPAGPPIRVRTDRGVETMTLEEYLWGVVAAEMPASFQMEALKAQAVAARTYAARRCGSTTPGHPEADVCTDHTCCQAYITPEAAAGNWGQRAGEYAQRIQSAVDATRGEVATYEGALIDAVFFSSSAGRTVDAVEVWGSHVPYLTGVESPEGEEVPNYHSTVEVTPEQFRTAVCGAHPEAVLEGPPGEWLGAADLRPDGGVRSMEIGGTTLTGGELRALFGLRSTSFTLSAGAGGLIFSVTGYGHGVGLSQYGANAMAGQGKDYRAILSWYYQGTRLTTLY